MSRKFRIPILVCVAFSLFGLLGCGEQVTTPTSVNPGPTSASTPADQGQAQGGNRTLVVLSYGGLWQKSFQKAVIEPFEASHPGVKIIQNISNDTVAQTLAKLRAEKNNSSSSMDIVETGAGFERAFADEGLVKALDPAKMPNLQDVYPAGNYKGLMVANSFNGTGLAYQKERVSTPPTSWFDLWDPKYGVGKVGIPDMANTAGYTLFDAINQLSGGTQENTEPGWAKYAALAKTMKPLIYANMSDEAMNAMTQRGANLIVAGNSRVIGLMDQGYPIGLVYPKEGAIAWGTYMGVVANSPNADLAMEFINFWLDPQVNANFCALVNYGPANQKSKLPADYKYTEYLMFGDALQNARAEDWGYLTKNLSTWTERWTTQILPLMK
jgi:putative spermidine/putrescine transport system substrate-binding protein